MSKFDFQYVERYSNEYPTPALRVHAVSGCCGLEFRDVAVILEPMAENPTLLLPRPLGLNGVNELQDQFRKYIDRRMREWERSVEASLTPGEKMRAEREDKENRAANQD